MTDPRTTTLYEVTKFRGDHGAKHARYFESRAEAVAYVAEITAIEKQSLRELKLTPSGNPHYVIRAVEVLA